MKILLIGLSHKTAPIEIRDPLAFTSAMLRSALTHFGDIHSQARLTDVSEGVILSTCNRLEIYAVVHDPQTAQEAIIDFISQSCDLAPQLFEPYLYIYEDQDAIRHLLRVASGLDSMVLGEPQILGQVTEAFQEALAQGAAGAVLSALFRAAIHTGKRARTETGIGLSSVSISSVAASLVSQLMGDLSQRQILLIGAGEMGAIAVRALQKRGISKLIVANRTYERAVELAQAWGGKAINFQQVPKALAEADIVITSTSAPHTILDKELLEPIRAQAGDRHLYIIDIALPRDVEPDVTDLPNVHLTDIDDLQDQAQQNAQERAAEVPLVERIVEEEIETFWEWLSSLEATSTITLWRRQIEDVRQQELQRLFNRLALDEREQNLVATMSHRLVNKILHGPTVRLKKETASGNGTAYIATVRDLFSLDSIAAE